MTQDPSHEIFVGQTALYALGGLEGSERRRFEQHLEICRTCVDEVSSFIPVTQALVFTVPAQIPPARLRTERIVGAAPSVSPESEALSASPESEALSASPESEALSASPESEALSASPESEALSASPESEALSASPESEALSASPESEALSASPESEALSASPESAAPTPAASGGAPAVAPPFASPRPVVPPADPLGDSPVAQPVASPAAPPIQLPRKPQRMSAGLLSMAVACLIIAGGLGWYAAQNVNEARDLRAQLEDATLRVRVANLDAAASRQLTEEMRGRADALAALDVTSVQLEGQPGAENAFGRAFLSMSRGVVITALNMPPLPPGQAYQVWFVLPEDPVSAGFARVDAAGRLFESLDSAPDTAQLLAVAVTMEPEGGVDTPSGNVLLLGRASR